MNGGSLVFGYVQKGNTEKSSRGKLCELPQGKSWE